MSTASYTTFPGGLAVRSDIAQGHGDLLGERTVNGRRLDAAELIAALSETFEADFAAALAARRGFLEEVACGRARYAFADPGRVVEDADGDRKTAAEIRQGMADNFLGRKTPAAWQLNAGTPAPAEVLRPGLQGTGPCDDLGMAMSALNAGRSGAVSWMWDWEDAGNDYGDKLYRAWRNLKEILAGAWDGKTWRHPEKGKDYAIEASPAERPVIFHRIPGLHLRNRQIRRGGRHVPGMIPALVIHTLDNLDSQRRRGSGIYFYVPKIETPEEARLVARILKALEEAVGVPRGTIKIEMLNERARYAAAQELILWVLRDWLIGPNVGRWDYLNSRIEMLKDRPEGVFPDPHTVGMTDPTLTEYTRRNALLSILVGGFPVGGMSAVMKNPRAPAEVNARAVRSVWFDKLRERLTGLMVIEGREVDAYRQSWVATTEDEYVRAGAEPLQTERSALPGLVARLEAGERSRLQALGLLDAGGNITPWRISERDLAPEKLFSQEAFDRLFRRPDGPVSEKGLRYAVYMASEYMFQQLNGNNAAAIDDTLSGTRLMNDFATYEIFWHWLWTALHHGVPLAEDGESTRKGERVTRDLMKRLLDERTEAVKSYFAEQDRQGVKSRFDRSKAGLTMEVLERQLFHARWIQYGSRVLDSVKEENESARKEILDAVFSGSREEVARRVAAGDWTGAAIRAHDFVYDIFGDRAE
jgi:malate synthase